MTWTTEKPTKAGWWWWWRAKGKEDGIVRIIDTQEGGLITQFENGHCTHLRLVPGEWSSTPLEPPVDNGAP